jgi:hypothetical protein
MRIAFKKKDLLAGIGAELLSLCSTITADGSISDEEVEQLRTWLDVNKDAKLPAIDFLYEAVARIIADGRVAEEERLSPHKALERVFPMDVRGALAAPRKQREYEEWKEELKNSPLEIFDFMVAGVTLEGRARIIKKFAKVNSPVSLV